MKSSPTLLVWLTLRESRLWERYRRRATPNSVSLSRYYPSVVASVHRFRGSQCDIDLAAIGLTSDFPFADREELARLFVTSGRTAIIGVTAANGGSAKSTVIYVVVGPPAKTAANPI